MTSSRLRLANGHGGKTRPRFSDGFDESLGRCVAITRKTIIINYTHNDGYYDDTPGIETAFENRPEKPAESSETRSRSRSTDSADVQRGDITRIVCVTRACVSGGLNTCKHDENIKIIMNHWSRAISRCSARIRREFPSSCFAADGIKRVRQNLHPVLIPPPPPRSIKVCMYSSDESTCVRARPSLLQNNNIIPCRVYVQ